MPRTPDRKHGPSDEEEVILEDRTVDGNPTVNGGIRFVGDDFVGKTSTGVKSLTQGAGGGITEPQHEALDTLTHALSETYDDDYALDADGIITEVVAKNTAGTPDIRATDQLNTDADGLIIGARVRQFDGAGVVKDTETMTVPTTPLDIARWTKS